MEKLIGVFTEHDGVETETLAEMINKFEIIGSTSADVGDIELYYDSKGTTYAIVHDSEPYFGRKEINKQYLFITKDKVTLDTNKIDDVITQILLSDKYENCNKFNDFFKFMVNYKDCDILLYIKYMPDDYKIKFLKKYGYTIYEVK